MSPAMSLLSEPTTFDVIFHCSRFTECQFNQFRYVRRARSRVHVQDRPIKAMYVKRDNEAFSRNYCCRGKVIRITSFGVCALIYPACKAHAQCYVVICAHSGSITFFQHSQKRQDFRQKVVECKM